MNKFKDLGNLALETVHDNDFETEYFPGGIDPLSSKETTGRWTRDEHMLFMRGLELYGKGWKKIASLVKTRTVVQIRTHAQKYFLKMSKARQSGEQASHHSQGKGAVSGISKKKHRHRPVAMTPLLMPFAQPADGFGSHPDPSTAASEESPSAAPACRLITVERTKLDAQERTPPHWYSKREKIECLLQIAESLDWTTEASTTLTSSSTGDTDSGSPCTSHSAQSAFQDVDPLASPLHTISTSSTSSAYGPYFDTAQYAAAVAATARTYSPDARELLWADEASFSAGPADISPTPRAVGLSGAGYPGNEESSHNFGETWPQKSQQQLQISTCTQQRRASSFQPDFTMFDYYTAEMDDDHAVEF